MSQLTKKRIGFVMEQTLGHVTHDKNLREWTGLREDVEPIWMSVPPHADDRYEKMPIVSGNWTLKASFRARELLKPVVARNSIEGLFFHTQVTALLSTGLVKRIPTVVSLDATPINVDTLGAAYNQTPSKIGALEAFKNRLNRRTFTSASHLITWCDWAKQSLISDYGISGDKITVIPPGIDLKKWEFDRTKKRSGAVRLLFVGGDFKRKGGELLLKAFKNGKWGNCELDIVTREEVDTRGLKGVRIHHGLNSNAPKLMELYANADVFIFPTLGDCLPIAVMEGMAAQLPVVATNVGAISEEVTDGVTGRLVKPGDLDGFVAAVGQIVENRDLRETMGRAGRSVAEVKFSGERNYNQVLDLILRIASGHHG
ncbi:MAG: glycosyltransferase family 4 protein, partial [Chthonomonadales bacterium]